MRRGLAAAGAALLLLGPAACGDDATPSTAEDSTTSSAATQDLPAQEARSLEPIYGAELAALGLRLTDRGGLIDRTGGGYEPSERGRHLALYVEPVGDRSTQEFIDGILDVGVVFADVFERWPGLESYDVCQEPVPDPANPVEGEPLPVTQIELSRAQAEAIDFETATVEQLVALSRTDPAGLHLRVSGDIARAPAYQAMVAEAAAAAAEG